MAEDKNLDDFTVPDAVEYLEGRLAFLEQVILITLSALPEEKRREAIATMNNINVGNLIREAIDAGHSPLYAKKLLSYSDTFSDGNFNHGNANDIFGGLGEDFEVFGQVSKSA